MKYASSIRYGGQLISAEDADYNSYKHLGLVCPECKNPVFVRAGHTRTAHKSGESIKVGQSFAHFKAQDPTQILACENRVAAYNRDDLERRVCQARNQRLKLLQRWFWDIFWRRLELDKNFESDLEIEKFQRQLPSVAPRLCASEPSLIALIESLPNYTAQRYEQCRIAVDGFRQDNPDNYQSSRISQRVQFLTTVDRVMQIAICTEVLDFLFSRSSRHLFFQVLTVLFIRATDSPTRYEQLSQHYGSLTNSVYSELILEVCWTDWAGEFERLSKQ